VPGWPLRNLLYLLNKLFGVKKIKVVCYREKMASTLIDTELPEKATYDGKIVKKIIQNQIFIFIFILDTKCVGWERNVQGKLGPRVVDLGPLMDPTRLADTSVDLNLKLMKWRVMPDLDLEKIKQTKCLLLGAGTLGCYVARCLIVSFWER
jgi:ubiquitin-like modifier-activating enzyme ATG7